MEVIIAEPLISISYRDGIDMVGPAVSTRA
jgi:hypothetical protein